MEFTFETDYNLAATTQMARALRKTVRKKRSRRTRFFAAAVILPGVALVASSFAGGGGLSFRTVVTGLAVLIILLTVLFEDQLNGYFARKRMLAGTEHASSVFAESGFESTTGVGKSEWQYSRIELVAESEDYSVFIFSESHAQVYDKRTLRGGSADEFRKFIEKATGKPVAAI